jgi:hypothetical protein
VAICTAFKRYITGRVGFGLKGVGVDFAVKIVLCINSFYLRTFL